PVDKRSYLFTGYGEIEGKRCVVLRSPNLRTKREMRYEFWVDVEHESAVLRSQFIARGKVTDQIDVTWESIDGRSFPKRWRYAQYAPGDQGPQLDHGFDLKVEKVVFGRKIEVSDFTVEQKPGMVVANLGEGTLGVVGPDGKSLLPLAPDEPDSHSSSHLAR